MRIAKTTVLMGYHATGDGEGFCFDRHAGPEEHSKAGENAGDEQDCRVYPNVLLPEGTQGKLGQWTITIAFEDKGKSPWPK